MKIVSLGARCFVVSTGLRTPHISKWEIRFVRGAVSLRFLVFEAFSDRWCDYNTTATTTFIVSLRNTVLVLALVIHPYAIRDVMVLARFFLKKPAAQNDDDTAGDVAAVAVISGNVASATAKRWERIRLGTHLFRITLRFR